MEALLNPPQLQIELAGKPLSAGDAQYLTELQVSERLSLPSQCELAFQGLPDLLGELASVADGAELIVRTGPDRCLFQGKVSALEYEFAPGNNLSLRIRAYDRLHSLRQRQAPRSYVDLTVTELAATLVGDLDIAVAADETGPIWRLIMQHEQSDLELLTEFAERAGLYFHLRDSVLQFASLAGRPGNAVLTLGENLFEARIEANSGKSRQAVTNLAWDPWQAAARRGRADTARCGRRLAADAAFHADSAPEFTSTDDSVQDDNQAEAYAQAQLDHRTAAETVFWGIAAGNPELMPGVAVKLDGLPGPVNGQYVLSTVTHRFDSRQGYVCELDSAPPPLRPRKRASLATVGVVTRVDDPDGLGRVKAMLPSYGELETDWIEVACAGAGKGKGLLLLPNLGDKVLLALIREDPAQAIVIGGLYGDSPLPDDAVVDADIGRYFLATPGGQRISLDDSERSIRLQTQSGQQVELQPDKIRLQLDSGSFFELADNGTRLHAEADLEIEAPGRTITIRGRAINFEQKS
ncbi:phage baseplate assembly protein V [Methylomonas sp. EFPC3]|uniref:phage baseplate assembly protein V n=1 Tax=Methylomonas sp. EFPC3 TaxID=3021710 RepID=UPI0024162CA9|nr:phage baseplate assembly protein V [Methylomonas sp. EFPC3]WFP50091.1 phage baseplate assembly protein V [Methylomonas sp. EFPC3]